MKQKILFWILIAILFCVFLYLIRSILLPFVIGMLVAYFLDPAADKLEKWGASRTLATVIITVIFFVMLATAIVLMSPLLYEQVMSFVSHVPEIYTYFKTKFAPYIDDVINLIGDEQIKQGNGLVEKTSSYILQFGSSIVANVWQSGVAVVNILSLIFITPVVTFYLLRDWDRITAKIDGLLPRKTRKTIREQIKLIDRAIAGFVRGQTNVCVIMGIFYAIGLMSVGLKFGLVIGLMTGILTFIPYAGFFAGFATAIAVASFQYSNWVDISLVAAVMMLGQVIESNFITPKLVGDKVGLHPLWLIFGMLAGAALLGVVGVFIAVPVTAIIGVLIRFSISRYKTSAYYKN